MSCFIIVGIGVRVRRLELFSIEMRMMRAKYAQLFTVLSNFESDSQRAGVYPVRGCVLLEVYLEA